MKIAVLKERHEDEARVAASPDSVKRLSALGFEFVIESGAGDGASFSDDVYRDVGAKIADDAASTTNGADIVLKIRGPEESEMDLLSNGQILVAHLAALSSKETMSALAGKGVTAFALELLPRITRAQSMDILSSQSNLAGYKAVLDAAGELGRAFPMMMTAAGTIAPAKVFIMGVGVAGLQAIATAKRMGAVVTATDVRPATKEQVESLGG